MPPLSKDIHGLPAICLPAQGIHLTANCRACSRVCRPHRRSPIERQYGLKVCQSSMQMGAAGKSAIHHRDDETPSISIVAHSSLFHWVTTLGKDVVWHLKTLHADFAPASRKYTSERRRSILIACDAEQRVQPCSLARCPPPRPSGEPDSVRRCIDLPSSS